MIDVEYNRLIRGDNLDEPILEWKVWFKTPFGLCETVQEAVEICQKRDVDPTMCIVPVAVAKSNSSHEAWER